MYVYSLNTFSLRVHPTSANKAARTQGQKNEGPVRVRKESNTKKVPKVFKTYRSQVESYAIRFLWHLKVHNVAGNLIHSSPLLVDGLLLCIAKLLQIQWSHGKQHEKMWKGRRKDGVRRWAGDVRWSVCIGSMLEGGARHRTSGEKTTVKHTAVKHQQIHIFLWCAAGHVPAGPGAILAKHHPVLSNRTLNIP